MPHNNVLVKPGAVVKLADHDPDYHAEYTKDDPEVARKRDEYLAQTRTLQERLYAEGAQSLLIVLQAMDGGGKDGTVSHVMSGLNPQSCYVASFKTPTPVELGHDFLWRVHERTPARGQIAVFNRSHYEDVLIARVHKLVPQQVWRARYDQINAFEELLAAGGTRILKFFLHISKAEQKRRLEARIADPTKHWKLSASDVPERELWDQYMAAYEDALSKCSTKQAPWRIIPANHKWYRNLVIADVIAATIREMDPKWPQPQVDVSKIVLK